MQHPPLENVPQVGGRPEFDNLLAVLRRGRPARPTVFEFFLNPRLYRRLLGRPAEDAAPQGRI